MDKFSGLNTKGITEKFFIETVASKHNNDIALALFSGDLEQGLKLVDDKEDMFWKLAKEQVKPLNGFDKVREWIESCGLKRATVTNAPRANAEYMISLLDGFSKLNPNSKVRDITEFTNRLRKLLR
ncbi:hypothetical protein HN51_013323 [Arachis hypogaea]